MPAKKPVKAYQHRDAKRAHIPSAEEAGYEAGSDKVAGAPGSVRLPLNPVLTRGQDPELFWKHKYATDERLGGLLDQLDAALKSGDTAAARNLLEQTRETIQQRYTLEDDDSRQIDIRSLYRHEHISPEQVMSGLWRVAGPESPATGHSPQATQLELFGNAIAHEELDKVGDYYTHSDGWTNRLIQGDSHLVMSSLLEREGMAGQVQCIYIDPPYGIKYGSNWQMRLNNRTVTDGKDEDLSGEPEQIKAFRDTWELGIHSYLGYLRDRLLVARQLLHESGSCFVQISDENVHLVRCLMDEVFGSENFVSLITFTKTSSQTVVLLPGTADYLLWFAKDKPNAKYRPLYKPKEFGGDGADKYDQVELPDGIRRAMSRDEKEKPTILPKGSRIYRLDNLMSQSEGRQKGHGAACWFPVEVEGREFLPNQRSRWKTNENGMANLKASKRLQALKNTLGYVRFLDDFPVFAISNVWTDIGGIQSRSEGKLYVVQTAAEAAKRCILMTTDPGDLVLDPTCGSGTTAYVAEQWGRRWITIDTSRIALNIAKTRLMTANFPYYELYDQERCDLRLGFQYKKVPHITLGSIANGEPPKEETLYDQPKEDKKRLRVAGPFTVETLQSYEPVSPEELARQRESDTELANFEDLIFEHLASAGVKTGDKRENAVFTRIDRLSHASLHAEGWYPADVASGERRVTGGKSGGEAAKNPPATGHPPQATQSFSERKAYLHIGPKFGTVSKQAVTEAIKACRDRRDGDWLLILGFAFESGLHETTKSFGSFQVSLVRMHDDLMQQGLLKKDKKAASFVTIGEPDVRVESGLWLVTSGGDALLSMDECEVLSGLGSLEAIHGLGREGLRRLADLAERGDLRTDEPSAAGGGVDSVKHRRGRGKADDGGVSAGPGTRAGITRGTGDPNDPGRTVRISGSGRIGDDLERLRHDQPDAYRSRQIAALQKLAEAASHPPLATRHYALVTIEGLDIYDPIKDEVKSRDVHDIAYWMLDDAYDGSNFVVRQVFFCGGDKDEFDSWRKGLDKLSATKTKQAAEQTLKIEIDDEAFDRLYGHVSHPFPAAPGQKVAVRVVSQFGEETTKVLTVE